MKTTLLLDCSVMIAALTGGRPQSGRSLPDGSYLGQKPPGRTPARSAADVFDARYSFHNGPIVFSPDGYEAYWQARVRSLEPDGAGDDAVFFTRNVGGRWAAPQIASFFRPDARDDCPFVSPDGRIGRQEHP
jgi:hypothetical protein